MKYHHISCLILIQDIQLDDTQTRVCFIGELCPKFATLGRKKNPNHQIFMISSIRQAEKI